MRALSITLEALCRSLHDELKGIGTHNNSRGNEAEQRNITKKNPRKWRGFALPKENGH